MNPDAGNQRTCGDGRLISGWLALPEGLREGTLRIRDGRIEAVEIRSPASGDAPDGPWIVPGFVDTHVHGVESLRFDEYDALVEGARRLARLGVAAFCPTLLSGGPEMLARFASARKAAASTVERERAEWIRAGGRAGSACARILGAHFEGPFVSPERPGAMDPGTIRVPSAAAARQWLREAAEPPALMTWAPELPGALDAGRVLAEAGVILSLGHCRADATAVRSAVALGARSVTHLHNTWLRPSECRADPAMASTLEAVLASPELFPTVIADLVHVADDGLAALCRNPGPARLIAITDSVEGAGAPPGEYRTRGGQVYRVETDAARLGDGTLLGSTLAMPGAFANLLAVGGPEIDPADAARMTSTNACRLLGLPDLGIIRPGAAADVAVMDRSGRLRAVFCGGAPVDL